LLPFLVLYLGTRVTRGGGNKTEAGSGQLIFLSHQVSNLKRRCHREREKERKKEQMLVEKKQSGQEWREEDRKRERQCAARVFMLLRKSR
jgi:hypothetical protein